MPRPTKEFLDYFPFYCRGDERTDILKAKKGMVGYGVYISLLVKLYGEKGYYLNWNDNICCIFARYVGIPEDEVRDIISLLIDVELFDKDIYKRYSVLTSKEIQENYLFAITKRKNKQLDKRFDLVSVEETRISGEETPIYGEETHVSVTESTQIKEKEIKENKIIENDCRGGVSPTAEVAPLAETQTERRGGVAPPTEATTPAETQTERRGGVSPSVKTNGHAPVSDRQSSCRGGVSPPAKVAPPVKTKDPAPAKRGRMNNVILTDSEYEQLKASYTDIDSTIERMSSYMASTGKSYYSHYHTLLRWAEEDKARGSIAPVYKGYAPKTQTNTKAASRESEGGFGESYDFDEFFAAAVRRGQNLYPIPKENEQNEGVPIGTLH